MTFITIWELSLVGTIAILVVLLLRKLSRSKVSYAAMVALWEIVLIRLLVPISMPNAISPLGTFHKLWQMQQPQTVAMAEGTYQGAGEKMNLMDGGQVEGAVSEETSQAASIQLSELLKLIWLVGMMIAIGISFIYFKRSMKVINEALPIEEKNDLGAGLNLGGNKVRLLQSDLITTPVTDGILRPKIILPSQVPYSKEELECVLIHEKVHIKYGHIFWKRLALMVVCIHWFNPLVYVMYRFINKDLELACDEQVIRRIGREKGASYALSLIHLAAGKQQGMALVSGFGKNDIEERVVCIMSKKNKSKVFSAVIVSLGVLSGSVLATTLPAQKGEQAGLSEAVQEEHMAYANVEDRQAENSLVKAKNSQQGEALRESWYRDYEVYGMTYDAAKDAFYYNGKVVRAFLDKVSDKGWRMFVRNNQGILVKAVRNGQNKLIGLKQLQGAEEIQLLQEMGIGNDKACDDKDYDEEWEEEEIISQKAAEKVKTFLKNEKSPTYAQDNPKAEYKAYGVSYNAEKKAWEWNGKVIRFLWDENKHWHVNNSVEAIHNGVKVKVVRDAKGNITKLVEMSDKEYNEFKKSNAFLSKAL